MRSPAIAVATDGAESGTVAVRWAAEEARRRRLPLRVVHVLDWDWGAARYDFGGGAFETARRLAATVVAVAVREARDAAPEVEVAADVLVGNPTGQLLGDTEHLGLLVLGTRGAGGFAGLRLGSVSQRVATNARCPVAVIREHPDTGPVVAGVDDSPNADAVLETAFTAADDRGAALTVIRALGRSTAQLPDTAPADLAQQVTRWHDKFPGVPVELRLASDGAAAALVAASHEARLVVVGSRGHGLLTNTLLGATSLQLLQHAESPILIVRRP
ncbi:universal stress protein [Actinoplanes teichomyceticus]|uniref:Nucleotide-binding universal stress UspA family protein n=1 Tax=Actinoplanes teichomyceticus TaxID=1867 RepID=A0A561VLQ9_ACTTI|nr:universal stress protein [Actinoplanes teichomyceticus]TWG12540.1 nucleotide-binding universal stress UspA family protein [Actinoplanes teichomyceticus]GIF13906.1 universal stress protein [Actinoplanes teichomyceticus]